MYRIILYYVILYYTQVSPGNRPAPPGGRPASRCRVVWGAATPPSGGSGGQHPPGKSQFEKTGRVHHKQLMHFQIIQGGKFWTTYEAQRTQNTGLGHALEHELSPP